MADGDVTLSGLGSVRDDEGTTSWVELEMDGLGAMVPKETVDCWAQHYSRRR